MGFSVISIINSLLSEYILISNTKSEVVDIMCFNYNALQEHIEKIKENFDFVSITSIGKGWCKRNIYSLSIGEGESSVLFLSDFSDTAGITSEILLTFFERLCVAYKNDLKISAVKIRSILREQKIVIVPITNPDGLEISCSDGENALCYKGLVQRAADNNFSEWISNARGVEIDKNFPYRFSDTKSIMKNSSAFGYKGPFEASELETQAIISFCKDIHPKYTITLSCSGEYISCQCSKCASDCAMMTQVFKSVSGLPIKRIKPCEAYGSFGGWFAKSFSAPSFCFSVSKRSVADLKSLYDKYEELLLLSSIM